MLHPAEEWKYFSETTKRIGVFDFLRVNFSEAEDKRDMNMKKLFVFSTLLAFVCAADMFFPHQSHGARPEGGIEEILHEHRESRKESVEREQGRAAQRGVTIGSTTVEDIFGHPPYSRIAETVREPGHLDAHRRARLKSVEREQSQLAQRGVNIGTRTVQDFFSSHAGMVHDYEERSSLDVP